MEVVKTAEAFDQTGLTDFAEGHAKYKSNRYYNKDRHQQYAWKNPYIGFDATQFFLHKNTSFLFCIIKAHIHGKWTGPKQPGPFSVFRNMVSLNQQFLPEGYPTVPGHFHREAHSAQH